MIAQPSDDRFYADGARVFDKESASCVYKAYHPRDARFVALLKSHAHRLNVLIDDLQKRLAEYEQE